MKFQDATGHVRDVICVCICVYIYIYIYIHTYIYIYTDVCMFGYAAHTNFVISDNALTWGGHHKIKSRGVTGHVREVIYMYI